MIPAGMTHAEYLFWIRKWVLPLIGLAVAAVHLVVFLFFLRESMNTARRNDQKEEMGLDRVMRTRCVASLIALSSNLGFLLWALCLSIQDTDERFRSETTEGAVISIVTAFTSFAWLVVPPCIGIFRHDLFAPGCWKRRIDAGVWSRICSVGGERWILYLPLPSWALAFGWVCYESVGWIFVDELSVLLYVVPLLSFMVVGLVRAMNPSRADKEV